MVRALEIRIDVMIDAQTCGIEAVLMGCDGLAFLGLFLGFSWI